MESVLVASPRADNYSIFLVVQTVHLHQHTRAARARQSANMVSADKVSILPRAAARRRPSASSGARDRARSRGAFKLMILIRIVTSLHILSIAHYIDNNQL